MAVKKAIFLGVTKIHSNKKNQDYRTVEIYTPPFTDANGFKRGGVGTYFTPLDSTIGEGIKTGAIVLPEFVMDPYSNRTDLAGFKVVRNSPYEPKDFE